MDTIIISTLGSALVSTLDPILEGAVGAFLVNHFHELNGLHQEQRKPAQQAMKAALDEWLSAILKNLQAQKYSQEELRQFFHDYQAAFKKFLHDSQAVEELLHPFFATTTDYRIDDQLLIRRWHALDLPQLPEEFDIASVNRAYLRRVKKTGIATSELRALFMAQLDLATDSSLQQLSVNNKNISVHSIAFESLAEHYDDHRKTYSLLLHASSHEPMLITSKRKNAVLIFEDDWRAVQETLYLLSIPGMRESIREGLETPIEECTPELDW